MTNPFETTPIWAIYCTILSSVAYIIYHTKGLLENFKTQTELIEEFKEMAEQFKDHFSQSIWTSFFLSFSFPLLFCILLYEAQFANWFIIFLIVYFVITQGFSVYLQNKILNQVAFSKKHFWIGKAENTMSICLMLWILGGLFA